jgi:formylglycine-generating enzyme required for sulfatase activity
MLTADGTAKLLDLGLARSQTMEATRLTQTGAFIGSPHYASPEQASGERELDIRSDIYSLGCAFYHMLAGKPPFSGTTVHQVLQQHLTEQVPWPKEYNPGLSDSVCLIIAKMMAKSPDDRYQVPKELLQDLDMLRQGRPPAITESDIGNSSVALRSVPLRQKLPASQRLRPGKVERSSGRRRRPSRVSTDSPQSKRPLAAMAGIGAAAVVGTVVAIAFMGGERGTFGTPRTHPPKSVAEPSVAVDTGKAGTPPAEPSGDPVDHADPKLPSRTAADALREAEEYEKTRPDDLSSVMAKYQTVSRDFPGAREAREAEINLARLRAALTANDREPVPATGAETRSVGTGKATATISPPAEDQPPDNAGKVSGPAAVDVTAILTRFDSFMSKGEHVSAAKYAETEAAKPANAARAKLLTSAARVAKALETRPAAIQEGARSLLGREADLRLKRGKLSGEVKGVSDDGLVVASVYYVNRQRRERTATHPWEAFNADQLDDLAKKGGWTAQPADIAVARAWAAFADRDFDAVVSVLAAPGAAGAPLTEYLLGRLAKEKVEAAYAQAMGRARARMDRGSYKVAIELIKEALAAKPEDTDAMKLLAEAERHIAPAPTLTLALAPGVDMEFVYIKPGVFAMGGTDDVRIHWQGKEKPKHEVAISKGFYIGKHEVTQAQYKAIAGKNPSMSVGPSLPVERVPWQGAVEFCRLATEKTRKQFRLPTEAEWEYACRAGSTDKWCFGSVPNDLADYAWFHNNSGRQTHPVGQKKPNAWGLHDMHGNVWEWVADRYDSDYYSKSPRQDPTGPDAGEFGLSRGGCCGAHGYVCTSAIRRFVGASNPSRQTGFRVVVSALGQP